MRPNLRFDESSEHVPPPPPGKVPDDILAQPKPKRASIKEVETGGQVEMDVLDKGEKRKVLTRAASGLYVAPPPPPLTGGESAATVQLEIDSIEIREDIKRANPMASSGGCCVVM